MRREEKAALMAGMVMGAVVMVCAIMMAAPVAGGVKLGTAIIGAFICCYIAEVWRGR